MDKTVCKCQPYVILTDSWLDYQIVVVLKLCSAGFCCTIHRALQPDFEYSFVVSEDAIDSR